MKYHIWLFHLFYLCHKHIEYVSVWFKLKTVVMTSKRGFVVLCLKVLFTLKEAAISFLKIYCRVITETIWKPLRCGKFRWTASLYALSCTKIQPKYPLYGHSHLTHTVSLQSSSHNLMFIPTYFIMSRIQLFTVTFSLVLIALNNQFNPNRPENYFELHISNLCCSQPPWTIYYGLSHYFYASVKNHFCFVNHTSVLK